jgi:hypothetical protein
VQNTLFTTYQFKHEVPYRSNQKEQVVVDLANKQERRRIEVLFARLCDQLRLKLNYAKRFAGQIGRRSSKLAALVVLQKVNLEKERPLNHIKHACS